MPLENPGQIKEFDCQFLAVGTLKYYKCYFGIVGCEFLLNL